MAQLGPKHDEVEGGDGVELAGVGVDGVQVPQGVGGARHVTQLPVYFLERSRRRQVGVGVDK